MKHGGSSEGGLAGAPPRVGSWWALGLLLALAIGGCDGGVDTVDPAADRGPLDRAVAADAAVPDAAVPDAAVPDAAAPDAAAPDAAVPDAAVPDAAVPDAAPVDAETPDAETPDAATPDMTPLDASALDMAVPDAATPDLATPDAEVIDAATPDAEVIDAATPDAEIIDAVVDAEIIDAVVDARIIDAELPDVAPPVPDAEIIDAAVDAAPLAALDVILTHPEDGGLLTISPIQVEGRVFLPIDSLTVAGQPVEPARDGRFAIELPLVEGENVIRAVATRGEDTAEATRTVTLDQTAPVVVIEAPAPDTRLAEDRVEVRGTVDDPGARVRVNGLPIALDGGAFSLDVPLAEGPNTMRVEATDRAGNVGSAEVEVTRDDGPPVIEITAPADGVTIAEPTARVEGTVDDAEATLTVNGVETPVVDGRFAQDVPLEEGANPVEVVAVDRTGNRASGSITINRDSTAPVVLITAPADGARVAAETVTLSGTVDDRAATVAVGELQAQVLPNGTWRVVVPLAEGPNPLTAVAVDAVGNRGEDTRTIVRDTTPPGLAFVAPAPGSVTAELRVDVEGTVDDPQAVVTVDGRPVAVVNGRFVVPYAVAEGANRVEATARDPLGNESRATLDFTGDRTAPALVITSPADDVIVGDAQVVIRGTVDDATATVTVNGVAVEVADGRFARTVELAPGANRIEVEARDPVENTSEAALTVTRDGDAPAVAITSPAEGARLRRTTVEVTGTADPEATVTVAGQPVELVDGRFRLSLELDEGLNIIEAIATDAFDNVGRASVQVTVDTSIPVVQITEPAPESAAGEAVTVRGTVIGDDVDRVEVAGVAVPVVDGAFERVDIPVVEGRNVITAAAADGFGNVGLDRVAVYRDGQGPVIHVESPAAGAVVTSAVIDVAGAVADYTTGVTIGAEAIQVWVEGQRATVVNDTFVAHDVRLQAGPNRVEVIAEDAAGNRSRATVEVTVVDGAGQRIVPISGQGQSAEPGGSVAAPLVVALVDRGGAPLADRPVAFEVIRGDGEVDAFPNRGQALTVRTDANGLARAGFTPGGRAGAGNHRVRASAAGFLGVVDFVASMAAGAPDRIASVGGITQSVGLGEVGAWPLVARVVDAAQNPVPGVEVRFRVVTGAARLGDDAAEATATTDHAGRARVRITGGDAEGPTVVEATFEGLAEADQAAVFRLSTQAQGPREATRVIGHVLDDQDHPLPGVTALIPVPGGPVLAGATDANGQFIIDDAPIGAVALALEGDTVTRPGDWPRLTVPLTTVAGLDNRPATPVRLPELNPSQTIGRAGGVLTLPAVPGATLEIAPDAIRCPEGAVSCDLSWTQVRRGRVPGEPPLGGVFEIAATVQPLGVRFDPPARLCLPNPGYPTGTRHGLFAYDPAVTDWVALGTATVEADGLRLCADTGFGVYRGGWHGLMQPPAERACPANCAGDDPCRTGRCEQGRCVFDDAPDGQVCDEGTGCRVAACQAGVCQTQSEAADGAACDDLDACTRASSCLDGQCVGAAPVACDDGDPCTDDSCDARLGCLNAPRGEGATCAPDDVADDACITGYTCSAGVCAAQRVECPTPEGPCQAAICDAETGACGVVGIAEGEPCGDAACGGGTCQAGRCVPPGGDNDGAPCDDGDACTVGDQCQAAICVGEAPALSLDVAPASVDLDRPIEQLAERVETLIDRLPFLAARFEAGGAYDIALRRDDCCAPADGRTLTGGAQAGAAAFVRTATVEGPLPALGFDQAFSEAVGDGRLDFTVAITVEADLRFDLAGGIDHSESACTDALCTAIEGAISLDGGLTARAEVIDCAVVGDTGGVGCDDLAIAPSRLVPTADGRCALALGDCPEAPGPCVFRFGPLDLVLDISYGAGRFQYQRVLYQ